MEVEARAVDVAAIFKARAMIALESAGWISEEANRDQPQADWSGVVY